MRLGETLVTSYKHQANQSAILSFARPHFRKVRSRRGEDPTRLTTRCSSAADHSMAATMAGPLMSAIVSTNARVAR